MRLWKKKQELEDEKEKEETEWKARKGLIHATRFVSFGLQIMKERKINDFSSCNFLLNQIKQLKIEDLEKQLVEQENQKEFENNSQKKEKAEKKGKTLYYHLIAERFKPFHKKELEEMKELTKEYEKESHLFLQKFENNKIQRFLKFIEEKGIKTLGWYFSTQIKKSSPSKRLSLNNSKKTLYLLKSDKLFSNFQFEAIRICRGLVLQKDNKRFSILSFPLPKTAFYFPMQR